MEFIVIYFCLALHKSLNTSALLNGLPWRYISNQQMALADLLGHWVVNEVTTSSTNLRIEKTNIVNNLMISGNIDFFALDYKVLVYMHMYN